MSFEDCRADVRAASRERLSDDEVLDLLEQVSERPDEAERLAQRAAERLEASRRAAARHALKRAETGRAARALMRQGMSADAAVQTLMVGTHRGVSGARASTYRAVQAFESRWTGQLMARISKAGGPQLEAKLRDPTFNETVTREMEELRRGGRPGISGDADARAVAGIYADVQELSRRDLNKQGAHRTGPERPASCRARTKSSPMIKKPVTRGHRSCASA